MKIHFSLPHLEARQPLAPFGATERRRKAVGKDYDFFNFLHYVCTVPSLSSSAESAASVGASSSWWLSNLLWVEGIA